MEKALRKALKPEIKRVKTKRTPESIEDRLEEKKKRSEKKVLRQKPRI